MVVVVVVVVMIKSCVQELTRTKIPFWLTTKMALLRKSKLIHYVLKWLEIVCQGICTFNLMWLMKKVKMKMGFVMTSKCYFDRFPWYWPWHCLLHFSASLLLDSMALSIFNWILFYYFWLLLQPTWAFCFVSSFSCDNDFLSFIIKCKLMWSSVHYHVVWTLRDIFVMSIFITWM